MNAPTYICVVGNATNCKSLRILRKLLLHETHEPLLLVRLEVVRDEGSGEVSEEEEVIAEVSIGVDRSQRIGGYRDGEDVRALAALQRV